MFTQKYIPCKIWVPYNDNHVKSVPSHPTLKIVSVENSWIVTLQEITIFDIIFIFNITFFLILWLIHVQNIIQSSNYKGTHQWKVEVTTEMSIKLHSPKMLTTWN